MFFLNLTAGEFLTLLGALGGLITALYLLDRTRRKKIVSTLRFWNPAFAAQQQQNRKRVREPWSLVLQLVSLLLLLLAIAQLEWGSRERRGQDHVLLLDTSSWTAQQSTAGTILDREKAAAQQYLTSLPTRDRAMVVRADALSVPATPFTSDRQQLGRAISESTSAFTALNIGQALSFARQARAWSGGQPGEIVYIGPQRLENPLAESDAAALQLRDLRVIAVPASLQNLGIRSIAVRRGEEEGNSWDATVTLKNYGSERRLIRLLAKFAGTIFQPRVLTLHPGQETAVEFSFITNTAGRFTASIDPHDSLPSDDQASLQLPASGLLTVAAFSNRPNVLRPLLDSNPQLSVKVSPLSAYTPKPAAGIMLLDEFAPDTRAEPQLPSLWIDPPKEGSPLPVKSVVSDAVIKNWQSDAALSTGLFAKETRIARAEVFETFEGDEPVAGIAGGPVVVARSAPKEALIGFDPLSGPLRFEVTTPLLFANLLRWLSPDAFRTVDITAGRVGTATVALDKTETAASLRVIDERGFTVPFTVRDRTLELFTSRPSIVRVLSADRDRVLSLTLPDIGQAEWKPAAGISTGVPSTRSFAPTAIDLWQWLAILGGLGLLTEWLLFGRRPVWQSRKPPSVAPRSPAPDNKQDQKPELVAK